MFSAGGESVELTPVVGRQPAQVMIKAAQCRDRGTFVQLCLQSAKRLMCNERRCLRSQLLWRNACNRRLSAPAERTCNHACAWRG